MNRYVVRLLLGSMVVAGLMACASAPAPASSASGSASASGSKQKTQASTPLSTQERREMILACTDLVLDYALFRDQLDVEKTANLFSHDARLSIQGQTFFSREAIRERMRDAQNGPMTRHLMSTIRITPVDANHATGISYVTIYQAAGGGSGESQSQSQRKEGDVQYVDGFAIIGNYIDEFVRTESGWRIANRHLEGAFQQSSP